MSSNSIVRSKLEGSLRVKSLTDLMRVHTDKSDSAWLLLDVSGSMGHIGGRLRNGKLRIEALREVVQGIVKQSPSIPNRMISFGGGHPSVRRVTSVPDAGGGTPLTEAIEMAKEAGASRAVCISDGIPDNPNSALDAARAFGGRIDVVFVGNPGEHGESFLKQLAEVAGGTQFTGDLSEPKELTGRIIGLLGNGPDDEDDED